MLEFSDSNGVKNSFLRIKKFFEDEQTDESEMDACYLFMISTNKKVKFLSREIDHWSQLNTGFLSGMIRDYREKNGIGNKR